MCPKKRKKYQLCRRKSEETVPSQDRNFAQHQSQCPVAGEMPEEGLQKARTEVRVWDERERGSGKIDTRLVLDVLKHRNGRLLLPGFAASVRLLPHTVRGAVSCWGPSTFHQL